MATLKVRGTGKPADFHRLLESAQEAFARTDNTGDPVVYLAVADIEVRPTLFQPREFGYGANEIDPDHVTRLLREIKLKGELDPILVIKLGEQWVCVDGHHRLKAYERMRREEPLKCERFQGASVWEAVEEGLRRNSWRQLTLENTDRQEAAWRHVVYGRGSISQIAARCGVSKRQVSNMREVKAAWNDEGPLGDRMRLRAHGGPEHVCWWKALMIFQDQDPEDVPDEIKAQQLARNLQSRMTNKLRENLKVGARALAIYSPELIRYVLTHPQLLVTEEEIEAAEAEDRLDPEELFRL